MTLSLALATVIVFPTVANAQEIKTENKAEAIEVCTKDKKECTKDGKVICNCDSNKFDKKRKHEFRHKDRKGEFRDSEKRAKFDKRVDGRRDCGSHENPLFKGITLTEEQQQQFKALRKKDRSEREAAFEKILTPDQLKQYNANKEHMKAHGDSRKAQKIGMLKSDCKTDVK